MGGVGGLGFLIIVIAPIVLRWVLLDYRYPKIILVGLAVGAVVGVIIAEVKDNWWIVLYSAGVGSYVGVIVELIYGLIQRKKFERRLHEQIKLGDRSERRRK